MVSIHQQDGIMKPQPMPRTLPLCLAVVLLVGVGLYASPTCAAGGNTYTVCASGCDFTSIQAALDDERVTAGDTIQVGDAVHTEAGITVRKDVTIQGQGAEKTIVQAHATLEGSPDRVFLITEGATVTIRDLTIRHGNAHLDEVDWRCGGGIANKGTLTVEDCTVHDNTGNNGGGIWSSNGTLTVVNCSIHHNTADRIAPDGWDDGFGGGIELEGGDVLTLVNSTVYENEAKSHGGGIYVASGSTATLTSCTISGNQSTTYGGGLYTMGELHLTQCTVANNVAKAEPAAGQIGERVRKDHLNAGGGVYVMGTLHYSNSIIANNDRGDCVLSPADAYGVRGRLGTNSNNLVGDGSCKAAYSGDPLLGPLADNGGPVLTHALLPGSPAIDVLPTDFCIITTDERGQPRPEACESADTPGDLGAFELQADQFAGFNATPGPTRPALAAAETEAPSAPNPDASGDWTLGTLGLVGMVLLGLGGLAGVWLRRRRP
jgi:parallel beta-helix repeat protein